MSTYPLTRTTSGRSRPGIERQQPTPAQVVPISGRIDTTTGQILQGDRELFSVERKGVGDVLITFLPTFREIPVVVPGVDTSVGGSGRVAYVSEAPKAGSVRIKRVTIADAAADGIITFVAHGLR